MDRRTCIKRVCRLPNLPFSPAHQAIPSMCSFGALRRYPRGWAHAPRFGETRQRRRSRRTQARHSRACGVRPVRQPSVIFRGNTQRDTAALCPCTVPYIRAAHLYNTPQQCALSIRRSETPRSCGRRKAERSRQLCRLPR